MAQLRESTDCDWVERVSAFTIALKTPRELSDVQRRRYRDLLLSHRLVEYHLLGNSLMLTFESGDRIQFHRALLPQVMALESNRKNRALLRDLSDRL